MAKRVFDDENFAKAKILMIMRLKIMWLGHIAVLPSVGYRPD